MEIIQSKKVMVLISKILFFFSHHGFYATIIFFLFFGIISAITKKLFWLIFIIPLSIANAFAGQFLNAWFLNKYGTESIAIITSDTETNSTLNDAPIHDYEAIVQKQDNRYVETFFSTMSASIYPITNEIRIPSVNEKFPVKYIPGYEKNIVILYNQTREGIARRQYEKLAPVNEAKIKYDAEPTNTEFLEEYISALENYTKVYPDDEKTVKIFELKKELQNLKK